MAGSNLRVARPLSSVTPVHSSLVGLLRDYLVGLFPAGYFRDQFVSTELAFRPGLFGNRRSRFRPMQGANVEQLRYPLLSVRVEPTADVSQLGSLDSYWQGRKFLSRPGLYRLVRDDEGLRYLSYERERLVCRFSVSVVAQTDLQAHEALAYLKRTMPVDRSTYLRGAMVWCRLPQDVVRDVYLDLGLSPSGSPADFAALSSYLQAMSFGRIRQTVDSATGRIGYSFPYRASPVFRVQGAPSLSVNRDGSVVRWAEVSFSAEMDLEVPNAFLLEMQPRLAPPAGSPDAIRSDGQCAYFGITVEIAPPSVILGRLSLVYHTGLVTGPCDPSDPGAPDVTALGPSVQPELRSYVEGIVAGPADPSERLQLVVTLGGDPVPPSGYSMDYSNWELSILQPGLAHLQEYQVMLYADTSGYSDATPDNTGRRQAPSPMYLPAGGAPQGGTP